MKTCYKCQLEKPLKDFNKNSRKKDGLQDRCRSCDNADNRKWYYANKDKAKNRVKRNNSRYLELARDFIWDLLEKSECIDCGESDPLVLEFDHVRGEKKYEIAVLTARATVSLAALKEEIEKCEIVCSNCHKRRTAKRGGWWRSLR